MRVEVRLFGSLREAAGGGSVWLELPDGAGVDELRAALEAALPEASRLGRRAAVAVNQQLVAAGTRLREGDEVALLPPVSGGGSACSLSEAPLDVAAVVARVEGSDAGAVVSFVGRVRAESRGHAIARLEYEAYPGMAERVLDEVAAEAAVRWPGARVAIAHRVGVLAVGEAAVVVAATAPHRAEAFDACRFAIDTLKQRVPIWKKEVAADGAWWVDEHP